MQTEELFFNCTLSAFITGPALLHHSHWLAASLGPVSQHVLLVWTHLRSTGWSADQKEGKRGEEADGENMDWRPWERTGGVLWLLMNQRKRILHVCVWMRESRAQAWDRQKNNQNKSQRQNIWLPGNRASSNCSTELWRMVWLYFPDLVSGWRWGGFEGGDKGEKTQKCLHLSWFVRRGEQ